MPQLNFSSQLIVALSFLFKSISSRASDGDFDVNYTTENSILTVDSNTGLVSNDFSGTLSIVELVSVSEPAHGTLEWSPDGSFNYTPDPGFHGIDKVSYTNSESSISIQAVFVVQPSNTVGVPGEWHMFGNGPSHTGYQAGFLDDFVPVKRWERGIHTTPGQINHIAVANNQIFVTPGVRYAQTDTVHLL